MIFVDTSAFIARYIEKDQYHKKALIKWKKIIGKSKLYTSNHIIDETITLLLRKTTSTFAIEKAKILYTTKAFETMRSDIDDELMALEVLEKYKDQKLSFTDCLSVASMKRNKIRKIFTFDNHFKHLFGMETI
ncbi:MAG: PIN domain-containing protein [bacterium]